MYVSYALNIAEMVAIGILTYLIFGGLDFEYMWIYIAAVVGGSLLLAPFNYRYSRVLLLHYLSPKVKYSELYDN